ncbi:MAG: hypothetical protein LBQ84_04345, partial [Flavobacteriaceae bacterium]|nr:hypothetical protein [Flavobacteriaceae bacterium]
MNGENKFFDCFRRKVSVVAVSLLTVSIAALPVFAQSSYRDSSYINAVDLLQPQQFKSVKEANTINADEKSKPALNKIINTPKSEKPEIILPVMRGTSTHVVYNPNRSAEDPNTAHDSGSSALPALPPKPGRGTEIISLPVENIAHVRPAPEPIRGLIELISGEIDKDGKLDEGIQEWLDHERGWDKFPTKPSLVPGDGSPINSPKPPYPGKPGDGSPINGPKPPYPGKPVYTYYDEYHNLKVSTYPRSNEDTHNFVAEAEIDNGDDSLISFISDVKPGDVIHGRWRVGEDGSLIPILPSPIRGPVVVPEIPADSSEVDNGDSSGEIDKDRKLDERIQAWLDHERGWDRLPIPIVVRPPYERNPHIIEDPTFEIPLTRPDEPLITRPPHDIIDPGFLIPIIGRPPYIIPSLPRPPHMPSPIINPPSNPNPIPRPPYVIRPPHDIRDPRLIGWEKPVREIYPPHAIISPEDPTYVLFSYISVSDTENSIVPIEKWAELIRMWRDWREEIQENEAEWTKKAKEWIEHEKWVTRGASKADIELIA